MLVILAVNSGNRNMLREVKERLSVGHIHKCVIGTELSSMYLACTSASTGMLADVLEETCMNEAVEDDKIVSLLVGSSLMGNIKILKMLLKKLSGAGINIGTDVDGITPLIAACYGGHQEIVKHLLEIGAEANICDDYNQSPLYFASLGGFIDIVHILFEAGADPTLTTDFSSSAIKIAQVYNRSKVETYLVEEAIPRWIERKNQENAMQN
jgi:ankyrin repeat protein